MQVSACCIHDIGSGTLPTLTQLASVRHMVCLLLKIWNAVCKGADEIGDPSGVYRWTEEAGGSQVATSPP